MSPDPATHLVFVDFENVPSVDLDAIGTASVLVTLLIGKNQTRLPLPLVSQIHRHASRVTLIEVGASGRNALDLVLAHYLGRAVVEKPGAILHIVSKDKDFEPLMNHLRQGGVAIERSDSLASLPFLAPKKPAPAPRKPVGRKSAPPPSGADDTLQKLIARLQNHTAPRPKRKRSLLHHINTAFGNTLTDAKLEAIVAQLIAAGILRIDPDDRVTY